ncbi:unnamed protein product [Sphagnum jensenii]|uniref:Transcription factor CBF/NF-Y/archaeal histone domain-containing protein n=1 Tax=Sphagnum jensenii TaxID=128206 RepID=A0ABP1AQ50_9BRYO
MPHPSAVMASHEKRERIIVVLVFVVVVVVSACATMSYGSREFKNHQLPLARIKKIMKSDEDVKMIAAESPVLFAKACEMFILELTLCSWIHTEENKWRTLQRNDVAGAITRGDIFYFLVDIVPSDKLKLRVYLLDEDLAIPWSGVSGTIQWQHLAKCCYQLGLCFTESTFINWQEMMVARPAVAQTPQMMYQPPQDKCSKQSASDSREFDVHAPSLYSGLPDVKIAILADNWKVIRSALLLEHLSSKELQQHQPS